MAKGQKRTTKEIRKPKQEKKPEAKSGSTFENQMRAADTNSSKEKGKR
ncbi:hypothetical protein QBK99_21360 [Corticibacterium sp. UT-5YL-CI-8]|nr:hypothetical protein [Tianweitania sp. UT-5YL-CI-8]